MNMCWDKDNLVMDTPLLWSKFSRSFILILHSAEVLKISKNLIPVKPTLKFILIF